MQIWIAFFPTSEEFSIFQQIYKIFAGMSFDIFSGMFHKRCKEPIVFCKKNRFKCKGFSPLILFQKIEELMSESSL